MKEEKKNLGEALKELEKIVASLDRVDFDIEEGLQEFRRGVDLVEFCRSELKHAENEFIELKSRLDVNTPKEKGEDVDAFENVA
jgi:exodeoxyribonuclease VII small subunit